MVRTVEKFIVVEVVVQNFTFEKTSLEGAFIIIPFYADDERGFFEKKFERRIFFEHGIDMNISETNTSRSKKGVIRGLHFQFTFPQAKLVGVDNGTIYDVIVDLRKDSKTFGQHEGFELSEDNRKLLYVPKGFAHGLITLSDTALVSYLCDGKYSREHDSGIFWNDESLNVDWRLDEIGGIENVIVSEKDKNLQRFEDYKVINKFMMGE